MDSAGKKQLGENGAKRECPAQREHPRPLMERAGWQSLNDLWDPSTPFAPEPVDCDSFVYGVVADLHLNAQA